MNTFFISKKIHFNNKTLDRFQSKAVLCKSNNYLVIAGAGSGKTLTIVAKVKYLLDNGYKEKDILCISFTNETVSSLKNIFLLNNIIVDVLTFHKLSLKILGNNYQIAPADLLEYTIKEFFESIIYHDNCYKLLDYIENINATKLMIKSFIMYMKSLNVEESFLFNLVNEKNIISDDKVYLLLILKVYLIYAEELKSENKIDFDDMINYANEKVNMLPSFQYKYIIIDEYQDTSLCKYMLIKSLVDRFNLKLLTVGDDYQSIYSFTGCKLSLFTKYRKYFPNSKIIKLKYTYRNPNDIVQISKRFVMHNRNQINKKLISNNYLSNSINIIYSNDEFKAVYYLLEIYDNILVLSRNNCDLNKLSNDNLFQQLSINKNIRLLTVHKSKGLEDDIVIVLNVIDDTLGFPNKINENKILDYIRDSDNLESERRLFYVALTRAKKKVYLLTKRNRESIFLKELIKEFKYKIKIEDLDQKNFK